MGYSTDGCVLRPQSILRGGPASESGMIDTDQFPDRRGLGRVSVRILDDTAVSREQAGTILDAANVIRDYYLRLLAWEVDVDGSLSSAASASR